MTQFSRSWRRRSAFIAVAATSALGVGLSAAPAFAHTPTWSVTCSEVSLNLTAYGNSDKNTVTVTVDGKDLLPTENFRNDFSKKLDLPAHKSELTVRLVVKAADGDQFSKDETKTAPVCEGEESTPPPAESTPPQEPSSSAPSESAPEAEPSKDTPATEAPEPSGEASTSAAGVPSSQPSPAGDDLAETGASSSTPLIAGAAGVVLVAGAGIMWAARKRRSVQG
ncbi:LAETG motif-containing sortase-dependent surface protein [Streptomyces sp. NPDC096310]|uniref:LAETG motif-containing sortase-dependent surface protein n=1 Tax=Streptomyces sp. NPDC096310 TaxID=3366082 RepID=UPI0037F3C6DE